MRYIIQLLLTALAVSVSVLLIVCCYSNYTRVNDRSVAPTLSLSRYKTADEMRYILYGTGQQQFSLYDRQLFRYIRSHISQASPARPRQLETAQVNNDASQAGQSAFVDLLLAGRRDGFFIECGAADGETFSNSLFFELDRNWTGLLIEANPDFHRVLLDKNRGAYVLGACLSTERRPMAVRMQPAGLFGGISDKMDPSHMDTTFFNAYRKPEVEVNCFPLNAIMAAIEVSHVGYFSLDVEGPEIEILQTVDWSRLEIDVISVEYRVIGGAKSIIDKPATLKKLDDLRQFFNSTGIYLEVGVLPVGADLSTGLDVVFARIRQ